MNLQLAPQGFSIQLMGGTSASEGRVQVCYDGTCGSLGKDVNLENPADFGDVVCRELNQGYATEVIRDGRFGPGLSVIKMNRIWCAGSEDSLAQCGPHVQWLDSTDPDLRDELTGVICSGPIPGRCPSPTLALIGKYVKHFKTVLFAVAFSGSPEHKSSGQLRSWL